MQLQLSKHAFWQRAFGRVNRTMPLTRWPLLLGGFLVLSLPFLPWLTVQLWAGPVLVSSPGVLESSKGLNPLRFFLTHQPLAHVTLVHFSPILNVALLTLAVPGFLGAIWLRGPIHTRAQRFGAVLLSAWSIGFISLGFYTLQWTLTNYSLYNYTFAGMPVLSSAVGEGMFYLTVFLLIAGLSLLWYEVWRQRAIVNNEDIMMRGGEVHAARNS
jgi:hypothetical protein